MMGQRRAYSAFVRFAAAALLAGIAGPLFAGEFYEKDGAAIKGYDPVAYFTDGKPVKGSSDYTAQFKGSTFRFATAANRDDFKANPSKYAPQYDGFCAYGVAKGAKAKTEPEAFKIVDGKLYLNYDQKVQEKWSADVKGFVSTADKNWSKVSKQTKVHE